jgi:hypothetical protein
MYYTYDVVDRVYDGIIAIKFKSKLNDYCLLIIAVYLPPEQSVWGRDGTGFYSHILKIMYENNDCDNVVVAGDTNSKIGITQDFIPGVDDNIGDRKNLDKSKNKHGQEMIDFLIESKMCVCNGRVTPEYDNYTFIHTRGKSVIDYMCVPNDCLDKCLEFKVNTARDMVNLYCNIEDEEIDLSRIIPDHSVLTLKLSSGNNINPRDININLEESTNQTHESHNVGNNEYDQDHIYFKRYGVKSIPPDFINNTAACNKLLEIIEDIEHTRELQQDIDDTYLKFCKFYHDEMSRWLKAKNVHPAAFKRFKRSTKPFWNDNLSELWNTVCKREKLYLLCREARRSQLKHEFCLAQKNFDREYRKAERNYKKGKIDEIEFLSTSDPKKFWEGIKKLGPKKKNDIPMQVYDDDQSVITDLNKVLDKWKSDFDGLYNFQPEPGQFDDEFYAKCMSDSNSNDGEYFEELDIDITQEEVKKAISHARNNKSVGIDNLPYEIFKNITSENVLTLFFNKIYSYHLTPSIWNLAIIKPLPKNSLADPRVPLEYRGISLLSTVYKLFTSVLNSRLIDVAELYDLYADEQNGFRKERSCADHIFSLSSIIRNRKRDGLQTYVAFVDFEKAFDRVDRNLLLFKLQSMGFGGKMLNMIKTIYSNCESCVNVNGHLTSKFSTEFGVRQGDPLSPTLFGLFINDLATDLNASGKGIKLNDDLIIALLLYADDLAIIADSEEDLQMMLNILEIWCKKWRMRINVKKTKIVHFRTPSQPKTEYNFLFNNEIVQCVDKYKYLGIILDEHLNFNTTVTVLAGSANRALGSIYTKFNKLKGLGFTTFTTLYNSGVAPILDYCSGIWGYQNFEKIDTVQNRALRFYLGVHKFAPNLAINGDMGWVSSGVRRKVEMFRYWNRLMKMELHRITKKFFTWDFDKRRSTGNWNSDIFKVFAKLNIVEMYNNLVEVDLEFIKEKLHENEKQKWAAHIVQAPKLRTYCLYKSVYDVEPYVYKVYNRSHRSILAQFRTGILPIKIETGRFTQIPVELRLCILCDENVIEDEKHFIFDCNYYNSIRNEYFSKFHEKCQNFDMMDNDEKLKYLMCADVVKLTAEFIHTCYCKRKEFIYR